MKQRLIKTSIKYASKKIVLFIPVILLCVSMLYITNRSSSAISCSTIAECEAKKAALEQEKSGYQAEMTRLSNVADTLQSALAKLQSEVSILQSQININQASFDQLSLQIQDTENKIQNNKDGLGKTIADMYVDDKTTPLEMIAGSENIGDYLDKQEFRSSVRNQLTATISEIKALKESLMVKKVEVERILGDQKNAKQALLDKQNEQQSLIDETNGQESAYRRLSAQAAQNLEELAIAQRALTATKGNLISDPTKGNYPWGGSGCWIDGRMDSHLGPNGNGRDDYGYDCRQCVSYAMWRILERTGRGYRSWGNAKYWYISAAYVGFNVDRNASAHSVGVRTWGQWGHVVWVETDPDANGNIVISQYNSYNDNTGDDSGPGLGNYSKKTVSKSEYEYFIHIP